MVEFCDAVMYSRFDDVAEAFAEGARRDTSSMKLPAAILDGVRGRCKKRETS